MAGITLAQAEAKLASAMDALDAALTAQEYKVGPNKGKRMADLDALQRNVIFWNYQVKRLTSGGIRVRGGTPIS